MSRRLWWRRTTTDCQALPGRRLAQVPGRALTPAQVPLETDQAQRPAQGRSRPPGASESRPGGVDALTEAAARGAHDLYYLDQCGFAPTMPTNYTWAREGVRPLLRYEAPQGRRVNVLGALAPFGPEPRFVYESRLAGVPGAGKLDGDALLDFSCREIVGLPGGRAALDTVPAAFRRERPCTIALDTYGVHHSKPIKAALPTLEAIGVAFYYLPPYSPKLNRIEPEWHALKYDRLPDRWFTTGPALKAAVEAALDERAAELAAPHDSTIHLPEAA